jgi:murein L,D-transpeptidase YafK
MTSLFSRLLYRYRKMLMVWETKISVHYLESAIAKAYATAYRPAPSPVLRRFLLWGVPLLLIAGGIYFMSHKPDLFRRQTREVPVAVVPAPAPIPAEKSVLLPPVNPAAAVQSEPARRMLPFTYGDPLNFLISDKNERRLFIYTLTPKGHAFVRQFRTAIGGNMGQKWERGDLKTPEGFYWIVDQKEYPNLAPIYGKRAFILNYPNDEDVAVGRTGNGIWIHGVERGKTPDKTHGCLALDNGDIIELGKYIGPGTPILITDHTEDPEPQIALYFKYDLLAHKTSSFSYLYRMKMKEAIQFVEKWRLAWESRDLEAYAGMYSAAFSQQGMDFAQWKEYKRGVFAIPQPITVEISQVDLRESSADRMVITFFQDYKSATFSGAYYKDITLKNEGSAWKIMQENQINNF